MQRKIFKWYDAVFFQLFAKNRYCLVYVRVCKWWRIDGEAVVGGVWVIETAEVVVRAALRYRSK